MAMAMRLHTYMYCTACTYRLCLGMAFHARTLCVEVGV